MFARMTRKGQITIPKPIRQKLNIENEGGVLFLLEEDEVKLKGVPGAKAHILAGSLKKYASRHVPLNAVRKKIRGDIADEIAAEGISD
jgi:AbrB family looped-hinge helix DNA binding protein